jgi:hypothetical protein
MNPGWEIRLIEYSDSQLKDYRDQNDPILVKSVEINKSSHINGISDIYRKKYLEEHKDEFIIYCDLDCFPISPFDNFIIDPSRNYPKWAVKDALNGNNCTKFLGYWVVSCENLFIQKDDIWCMCNNSNTICTNSFLQIHRGLCAKEEITVEKSMIINKSNVGLYRQRNKDFHEMKIELGDNFCLPQFTPIEHYYSFERNKLNLNAGVASPVN